VTTPAVKLLLAEDHAADAEPFLSYIQKPVEFGRFRETVR
jgi:hypothetical protein